MHAVYVEVHTDQPKVSRQHLHERVVPGVSQAPGFVAGYWLDVGEDNGRSVVVFESEDAAEAMAGKVRDTAPSAVTIDHVSVHEVIAHAERHAMSV